MQDSTVDESYEQLLAVLKRIQNFSKCMPVLSQISWNVMPRSSFLYLKVHMAGGFQQDKRAAVVAGCFYIVFHQLSVPCTFRKMWFMTGSSDKELEAFVKDPETFFAEENAIEIHSKEAARH